MILIVIPAKGESSRLPNKNMSILNGKPMIAYAIDAARKSREATRVIVSTDDDRIDRYCSDQGVEVVRRPRSLGGDVPLFDVYRHAAEQIGLEQVDILIGLQPDHPDRSVSVDEALVFFKRAGADLLTSTEADGTKNGAYKIYTRAMLKSGVPAKEVVLIDNCTNVHYAADLEKAAQILLARKNV